MGSDSDVDTSRTVVQTYVPAYQRDQWDEHADELDMSRSEFVKTMVQAGRRHFGEDAAGDALTSESDGSQSETDLQAEISSHLRAEGPCSWDDLLAGVTGDIETRLENTLQELQDEGQVRYSGREGGYVLMEE